MTTILTPEQQEWVDALRYGDFQQGKGMLCTADYHHCCLGVACHISDSGAWTPINEHTLGYDTGASERPEGYLIPKTLQDRLRLRTSYGLFNYTDQIRDQTPPHIRNKLDRIAKASTLSLTHINDARLSFADIADIIERAANELFHPPEIIVP